MNFLANTVLIRNRVDDKTGSVDNTNGFADQYSILYLRVPSEPTQARRKQFDIGRAKC